jgi:predicted DNA-binding transcriptional regulator AlpA
MHPAELLKHFDEWEYRTRGLSVAPHPVPVEPIFAPLFPRERTPRAAIDDGRRPGLLERLRGWERALSVEVGAADPAQPTYELSQSVEFDLLVPRDFSPKIGAIREWLGSLHALSEPLRFEILGLPDRISLRVTCGLVDRTLVASSTRAYFPEAKLRESAASLSNWLGVNDEYGAVLGFGLQERVFRQLNTAERLDVDPLTGIVGALDSLGVGEVGVVQVLLAPTRAHWRQEFEAFASSIEDVDRVLPVIRAKFAEPSFAVVLRVAAFAPNAEAADMLVTRLAGAVTAVMRSPSNALAPVPVVLSDEMQDLASRSTRRSGMLLSLSELLTLVHAPSASVRSERLVRLSGRTKAAPAAALGHPLLLGVNEHDGETRQVSLSLEHRLRHTYLIGASGTGKSTLLLQMALQDLTAGHGLAVLDPHGDLIDDLLARIPENRIPDVVLFDPTDEAYPVGFNILNAHSELEQTLLSSDLVSVFRRLSSSFGDQMAAVLGNAVLAFLEHPEGGTLIDLRRFLIDKSFRVRFLEGVQDEQIVSYWQEEYPLLKGLPHAPLLTRLNTFLRPKLIRHMVAQKDDRLDMRAIMDGRKILLARLAQGGVGEENAHLLGSLLVARIAQAAMSRQETAAADRTPFFTYIDEFHHFVTPSIAAILSGARKYGLGLTLAHQEMRQLKVRSEEVASAVLANAATRIVFRVGEQDAKTLAEGLSFFESRDIQNLGIGEAIVRLERPDQDFNLRTPPIPAVNDAAAAARRLAVRLASRTRYGRPKDEIQSVLQSTHAATTADEPAIPRTGRKRKESLPTVSDVRTPSPVQDHLPGRGGPQHKYLQSLVRKLAEDRGFTASIEKRVLDGHGHVDVLLERDGLTVGCEISITTDGAHEADNLSKCLAAGFDHVALICPDEQQLSRVRALLGRSVGGAVRFLTPEELIHFLDELVGAEGRRTDTSRQSTASPHAQTMQKLRSAEDTAARLSMKPQTLAKMRWSGDSPPFVKIGRRVFYDDAEVDTWIALRRRRSTSDPGPVKERDA